MIWPSAARTRALRPPQRAGLAGEDDGNCKITRCLKRTCLEDPWNTSLDILRYILRYLKILELLLFVPWWRNLICFSQMFWNVLDLRWWRYPPILLYITIYILYNIINEYSSTCSRVKSASGTRQSTKKQRMVALLPTDTVWSVEQLLDSGKVVEFVAGERFCRPILIVCIKDASKMSFASKLWTFFNAQRCTVALHDLSIGSEV